MGRYIWSQPMNIEYLQAYLLQPHWHSFSIISLEENHRQQGDSLYADILNRIRVGSHTNEDISKLKERVCSEGHRDLDGALVIASTHNMINKYNDKCLLELTPC